MSPDKLPVWGARSVAIERLTRVLINDDLDEDTRNELAEELWKVAQTGELPT